MLRIVTVKSLGYPFGVPWKELIEYLTDKSLLCEEMDFFTVIDNKKINEKTVNSAVYFPLITGKYRVILFIGSAWRLTLPRTSSARKNFFLKPTDKVLISEK